MSTHFLNENLLIFIVCEFMQDLIVLCEMVLLTSSHNPFRVCGRTTLAGNLATAHRKAPGKTSRATNDKQQSQKAPLAQAQSADSNPQSPLLFPKGEPGPLTQGTGGPGGAVRLKEGCYHQPLNPTSYLWETPLPGGGRGRVGDQRGIKVECKEKAERRTWGWQKAGEAVAHVRSRKETANDLVPAHLGWSGGSTVR